MDWNEFQKEGGGLLIVGHGTRRADGVRQFTQMVGQMRDSNPTISMVACFLELASPSIEEGLRELKGLGCNQVLVVPILLFEAAHAKLDIPNEVALHAAKLDIEVVGQSPPLDNHPFVIELSERRFTTALTCQNERGCLRAGGCSSWDGSSQKCQHAKPSTIADLSSETIALAMVGRGSTDSSAIEAMLRFTQSRVSRSKNQIVWCETGFVVGGGRDVDAVLDAASQVSASTIVVQPHLLFEGEIVESIRQKVAALSQKSPKKWLVPLTLGADESLARIFLGIAAERLKESTAGSLKEIKADPQ